MKNRVKAKQKRTIIISLVLSVLLVASLLTVIIDYAIHFNDIYKQFSDVNFAKAYANALGYDSFRDLTQEDLDKVESLRCYVSVGYDEQKNLYAYPVVELGFAETADKYLSPEETEDADDASDAAKASAAANTSDVSEATDDSAEEKPATAVYLQYIVTKAEDLNMFKNLRVLYLYDYFDIESMQNACNDVYSTFINDYYSSAIYGSTQSYSDYITFEELIYGSNTRGIMSVALNDLKDLSQISSLTNLEHLSLEYTGITSLEGIESFPKLTKLDIGYTSVDDISAVSSMTGLTDLSLVAMGKNEIKEESTSDEAKKDSDKTEEETHTHEGLSDISALSALVNLEKLNLMGNAIVDISALEGMANLNALYLNSNCVENLDALAGKTKLEYFSVSDNHLTDIKGISDSTLLVGIDITNNSIKDISPLANCSKIETIYAYNNEIASLGDLSNMESLKAIYVYSNKLTDISGLAGCEKLETISAYENEITTIGDLSSLDALTSISIYSNKITDLNGLNGCKKLDTITAYDNKLSGKLDLTDCPELKSLNIYVSDVTDNKDTEEVEATVKGTLSELNVEGLTKLTSITAYNNSLTTLNIKNCAALTSINLTGNAMTAIPDLTGCGKLTSINLSNNAVTDVSGAAVDQDSKKDGINTVVTTLTLNGNKISDISALKDVTSLTSLNLADNQLSNITAIGSLTTLKTLTLTNNSNLADLKPISENFASTSTLTLNIVGTKAAENADAIKEMQKKFSTMKITYKEETEKE